MVEDIVFEVPVPHLLEEIVAVVQFAAQAHMEIFVSRFKEDFVEMFQVPSQERTFEHLVDRTAEFIVPQIQENIAQMLFQVPIQERSQEGIVEKSFPRSAFLGSSKRVTLAGTLRRGFLQAVRQDENLFSSGNTIFDPNSNGKTKMKSMFMTFFTQLHFLKIVICEKNCAWITSESLCVGVRAGQAVHDTILVVTRNNDRKVKPMETSFTIVSMGVVMCSLYVRFLE